MTLFLETNPKITFVIPSNSNYREAAKQSVKSVIIRDGTEIIRTITNENGPIDLNSITQEITGAGGPHNITVEINADGPGFFMAVYVVYPDQPRVQIRGPRNQIGRTIEYDAGRREPCKPYEPARGASCRPGFSLQSGPIQQYRINGHLSILGRSFSKSLTTPWAYGLPFILYGNTFTRVGPFTAFTQRGTNGTTRYSGRVESRTVNVTACVPPPGCMAPIMARGFRAENTTIAFTVNVPESREESQERIRQEEAERIRRLELEQASSPLVPRTSPAPGAAPVPVPERPDTGTEKPVESTQQINPEDTKYRIISPVTYSVIQGKEVPDIRYESVRYLNAAAASSYVLRGYELQIVGEGVPVSSSKPYGGSIIERSRALKGPQQRAVRKCSNCKPGRTTWADINKASNQRNFPQVGGVRKRINTRKVVR